MIPGCCIDPVQVAGKRRVIARLSSPNGERVKESNTPHLTPPLRLQDTIPALEITVSVILVQPQWVEGAAGPVKQKRSQWTSRRLCQTFTVPRQLAMHKVSVKECKVGGFLWAPSHQSICFQFNPPQPSLLSPCWGKFTEIKSVQKCEYEPN